MLVEAKYPTQFNGEKYDAYLANGFFRGASMMYKTKLLCIGSKVSSVINIRLPLDDFELTPKKKKLIKKVEQKFTIKVRPYYPNKQHDLLYQKFKSRFKGFLYPDIESFLSLGSPFALAIYNTHVLEVYDNKKLIAFSLFDYGKVSCAGLLAIYDFNYADYSLGNYTMFKEILVAKGYGLKYYYPGYILNNIHDFDYKLRIGKVETLDWKLGWRKNQNIKQGEFLSDIIHLKIDMAKMVLASFNVDYELLYYPNFSLAYLIENKSIFNFPAYFKIKNSKLKGNLMMYFDHDQKDFVIGRYKYVQLFPKSEKLEISVEYENAQDLDLNILECTQIIYRHAKPHALLVELGYFG